MDSQTGIVVSPLFIPKGDAVTFRIGGGRSDQTYIALCTVEGKEVETIRGRNTQEMYEVKIDLKDYTGKQMFLKIVDQATGGWGHITADDFQFDAEVLGEYPVVSEE